MKKNCVRWALVVLSSAHFLLAADNALSLDFLAQGLNQVRLSAIASRQQNMSKEDLFKELEKEGLSKEVTVLPTRYKLKPETEIKMQLPLFGLVVLKPIFDKKGYVEGFQSVKPVLGAPWEWGPLVIEQGIFKLIDGKLTYLAWGTFFGKKIHIGLKEFSLTNKEEKVIVNNIEQKKTIECYRMVIGVLFDEKSFAFELLPGRKVVFKSLDIVFEEGKGLYVQHEGEIFDQPVTVSMGVDSATKEFKLSANISQRPLTTVLPEFKNTIVDGLEITGNINYTAKNGLIIKGKIISDLDNTVDIAGIVLEEAHIDVDTKKGHALISGNTLVLGLPLRGYFALLFGKQKGIKFTADVPHTIKEWKPFQGLNVGGLDEIVVHEIKAAAYAQYKAAEDGDKKIESKPFPTKDEDIIKNAEEVILEGSKGASFSFFVRGKSTILNTPNEIIFKMGKKPGSAFAVTFCAVLPQGWKLSRSFPEFFKPIKQKPSDPDPDPFWKVVCDGIDTFQLDRARIIASTTEETIEKIKIKPGLNIMADVTIDARSDNAFIKGLAQNGIIKEGSQGASLGLRGNINPTDPRNAFFMIDISSGGYGLTLGEARFDSGALGLAIRGNPSVSIAGKFRMKPSVKDEPLFFNLGFDFRATSFGISGSMENKWKNPFGIQGFEFGDLGVNASQTYTMIAEAFASFGIAALIPATLGFTGKVKFGKNKCFSPQEPNGDAVCARATFNVGKDITNLALVAEITSPLSLVQLLDVLFEQMDARTDIFKTINKMVPVTVKKGSLYFVPGGTNIGNITIQQGMGASLYLDLFGREAHIDGNISLQGFTAKGKIPAFECGPLIMTNADETCDTQTGRYKNSTPQQKDETCGPTIDIQANVNNLHFIIDGMMKFGNIFQSRTKWYISADGIHFNTHTYIGSAESKLGLRLKGSSVDFKKKPEELLKLKPEDLFLEIEFEDSLSEVIRADIAKELVKQKEQFEKDINFALDQISRQTIQKDIDDQQEAVYRAARGRVSFFSNPALSISREMAYRSELTKLDGLKLKYGLESSWPGQILSEIARRLGIDKAAQHVLMGVRTIGLGAAERIQLFFKDISKLVIVKRAYWKGAVADIAKGTIPGIELELCTGCEVVKVHTPAFNLNAPIESAHSIAFFSIGLIKDVVIASFNKKECSKLCSEQTL